MADTATIIVLRSSDASRTEIKLPLSASLNQLKDSISRTKLGPIERKHQRLFHLGREMKSGGRSLEALGFGKHDNFLVHLHSTKPKTLELSSDEEEDDVVLEAVVPQGIARDKHFASPVSNQAGRAEVVDLLDDDSEDEDVAVVETVSASEASKRRRLR
eukprot:CAMPEP_0183296216 /NCGR_PEP_ID=MMETSP0160_2-20130417/3872_1 /TAXON_ID=2839 ORGANISM="Odontella Sinensis, Strain Grunow 1884" /NCGR_SAMPLE_ID=MMETSP0160_2 /ASSEMBLY_ACC=CAM_ASM_000250 /LENGTH=158 /DNA_ID=CAMNT_0025457809 /DNA_START=251 /DNA_END=727 /DNA_ORIENTATION=+